MRIAKPLRPLSCKIINEIRSHVCFGDFYHDTKKKKKKLPVFFRSSSQKHVVKTTRDHPANREAK